MTKFLNFTGLTTFFNQLRSIFATDAEIAQVEADTETYVLNIDYEKYLAFDTKEIITSDDITLEDNESLLSTTLDEILVSINDEYIIIEKGE